MTTDVGNVRAGFPKFPPHFWSPLTGSALSREQPLIWCTAFTELCWAFLLYAGSVCLNYWNISVAQTGFHPWHLICIPLGWVLTVSGARYLAVVLHHECVHQEFSGSKSCDIVVGEVISIVTFTQNYHEYHFDHVTVHHSSKLATLDDPDLQFLRALGFVFGATADALWRHLSKTLISPVFHAKFLSARLRSNFLAKRRYRQIMAVCFWACLLLATWHFNLWPQLLFAYLLPITVLYNISSLLQFLCEHQWMRVRLPGESKKVHLVRLTTARFCGEPAPSHTLRGRRAFAAWTRWYFRMFTIHLFARVFVLVGDLPVHDFHHLAPHTKQWPNAVYARRAFIDAGCPGWPEAPAEIWGLWNAINRLFVFWSSLPTSAGQPDRETQMPPEVFVPFPSISGIVETPYPPSGDFHVL